MKVTEQQREQTMTDKELQELKDHATDLVEFLKDLQPDETYQELKWFVLKLSGAEEVAL